MSLNTCRGVIRCQEFVGLEESEIQSELASQCMSHVKHICLNKGQKKTNTYILTYSLSKIPAAIKIGYISAKVSLYFRNPLRCFRCQRFGHGQGSCIRTPRCVNCTEYHVSEYCTEPSRCAHCPHGASHKASDGNCPMFLKEKEILRIKYMRTFRSLKLGHRWTIYSRNPHLHHIHISHKADQNVTDRKSSSDRPNMATIPRGTN